MANNCRYSALSAVARRSSVRYALAGHRAAGTGVDRQPASTRRSAPSRQIHSTPCSSASHPSPRLGIDTNHAAASGSAAVTSSSLTDAPIALSTSRIQIVAPPLPGDPMLVRCGFHLASMTRPTWGSNRAGIDRVGNQITSTSGAPASTRIELISVGSHGHLRPCASRLLWFTSDDRMG